MKFGNLDELIDFEQNLQWVNEDDVILEDLDKRIQNKAKKLKNKKLFGVYNDEVVSVVSEEFRPISVKEVATICDQVFGEKYIEKSYRQGIARIYDKGIEDRIGEVKPIVIYPANLGTMAVNIGIHHNAFICSNGLFMSDNFLTRKIIHRLQNKNIEQLARQVSNNLGTVLKRVSKATETEIQDYLQLGLIVQGLSKNDRLVNKALNKYAPQSNTVWETIQSITYVARDERLKGYKYAKKAGTFLMQPTLEPYQVLDAANYLYKKEQQGKPIVNNAQSLYAKGIEILGGAI